MEIKLHFTPELPKESCECVVFHYNTLTGNITTISNVNYSAVYGAFNMYDHFDTDYVVSHAQQTEEYNASIIAWAYMDEVTQGVFDEIHG